MCVCVAIANDDCACCLQRVLFFKRALRWLDPWSLVEGLHSGIGDENML